MGLDDRSVQKRRRERVSCPECGGDLVELSRAHRSALQGVAAGITAVAALLFAARLVLSDRLLIVVPGIVLTSGLVSLLLIAAPWRAPQRPVRAPVGAKSPGFQFKAHQVYVAVAVIVGLMVINVFLEAAETYGATWAYPAWVAFCVVLWRLFKPATAPPGPMGRLSVSGYLCTACGHEW